jgi:hypothetical protein
MLLQASTGVINQLDDMHIDSGSKKNECILGGCLAIVVVMLPKKALNKTLHIEIAVKNHFASIV